MDNLGNKTITLTDLEEELAKARLDSSKYTKDAIEKELNVSEKVK